MAAAPLVDPSVEHQQLLADQVREELLRVGAHDARAVTVHHQAHGIGARRLRCDHGIELGVGQQLRGDALFAAQRGAYGRDAAGAHEPDDVGTGQSGDDLGHDLGNDREALLERELVAVGQSVTGEIDSHGVEAGRREQLGERAELVEVALQIVHEDDCPPPGALDRDPAVPHPRRS